jgi:hypothetical protein
MTPFDSTHQCPACKRRPARLSGWLDRSRAARVAIIEFVREGRA